MGWDGDGCFGMGCWMGWDDDGCFGMGCWMDCWLLDGWDGLLDGLGWVGMAMGVLGWVGLAIL